MYLDTGSEQAQGGRFLGTQVDTRSTSLRTPVTLKSLSTAYQRRTTTDPLGVSCNTIPDTRSTTSRPACKRAAKLGTTTRQDKHSQQHTLPAASTHTRGILEQGALQDGCLNPSEGHDADPIGSDHAAARPIATDNKPWVDTSRVLFTSPQGSAGLSAAYVSPAGGPLRNEVLQPSGCAEPHKEKRSVPPNARALTNSEQQSLQECMEEGVHDCFVVTTVSLPSVLHRMQTVLRSESLGTYWWCRKCASVHNLTLLFKI
jgi:hypothetical protein